MELTTAQKNTLDALAGQDDKQVGYRVVGCDARTGSLKLRAERLVTLMPDGSLRDA
jgi:hypothetical protein